MGGGIHEFIEKRLNKISTRRWTRRANTVSQADLRGLRRVRRQAKHLRWELDRFLFVADERLALPLVGSNAMQLPLYTEYAYRPELWRGPVAGAGASAVATKFEIGTEATLFHDCFVSELSCRQIRNRSEDDLAPFGLRLEVFRFDGTFMSLMVEMPAEAAHGLSRRSIVRLDYALDVERPIGIFARLNVKHGPNLEQMVRELPLSEADSFVEFDLAYSKLNEKRVEQVWVDFVFQDPQMNQIVLRDVTMSRRPRAEL